jgi:uncharacterized protein HemY
MANRRAGVLTFAVTIAALAAALYFAARFGDVYRDGDSEHRRHDLADAAAIAVPLFVGCVGAFVMLVHRINSQGMRAQWRHEQAELRAARGTPSARRT